MDGSEANATDAIVNSALDFSLLVQSSQAVFILLQVIVLAITAYIIYLYTRETQGLREVTQEQTKQIIQPLVVIDFNYKERKKQTGGINKDYFFVLFNCTNNPALNISLDILSLNKSNYDFSFQHFPILYGHSEKQFDLKKYNDIDTSDIIIPKDLDHNIHLSIQFSDLRMKKYIVYGVLSRLQFKINQIKELN